MMEEQNQVSVGAETGGGEREGGDDSVKDETFEQEEDQDDLPHSEILDIFEEGLAQLVQDPLLCDLPIQVAQISHHIYPRFCHAFCLDVGLVGAALHLRKTVEHMFSTLLSGDSGGGEFSDSFGVRPGHDCQGAEG